jgi:phenylalanyl-tRNA synthetase alpha chain
MDIREHAKQILDELEQELKISNSSKQLEELKVLFLGKKGKVQGMVQHMHHLTDEERPLAGKEINLLKEQATSLIEEKLNHLKDQELTSRLEKERLDISLPGSPCHIGHKHPVRALIDRALSILKEMGFTVQTGPDIETDYYNFESLNFPDDHPARDMQDTFYIAPGYVLRTHTSNVQVRIMESHKPPIRAIAVGKCYRSEDISARSHVLFHQIEGFYIDKHVTFKDLFTTLTDFFTKLFGKDLKMRFRPSYFPFVEPGLEVDISCFLCNAKGCPICKKTGWLEVAGAGMIHPEVLNNGGIDPEEYNGFAWALGIERLVMLTKKVPDIRLFLQNFMHFDM